MEESQLGSFLKAFLIAFICALIVMTGLAFSVLNLFSKANQPVERNDYTVLADEEDDSSSDSYSGGSESEFSGASVVPTPDPMGEEDVYAPRKLSDKEETVVAPTSGSIGDVKPETEVTPPSPTPQKGDNSAPTPTPIPTPTPAPTPEISTETPVSETIPEGFPKPGPRQPAPSVPIAPGANPSGDGKNFVSEVTYYGKDALNPDPADSIYKINAAGYTPEQLDKLGPYFCAMDGVVCDKYNLMGKRIKITTEWGSITVRVVDVMPAKPGSCNVDIYDQKIFEMIDPPNNIHPSGIPIRGRIPCEWTVLGY